MFQAMTTFTNDRVLLIGTVVFAMALEVISQVTGINGHTIFSMVAIAALIGRAILGPSRVIFATTAASLLCFYLWRSVAAWSPDGYGHVFGTIGRVMGYGFALFTLEYIQRPSTRSLWVNVISMVVLLGSTAVVQIIQGRSFSTTFTYLVLYYLYISWIIGKTIELRPWNQDTPKGIRLLGTGYLFVLVNLLLFNLRLFLGTQSPVTVFLSTYHVGNMVVTVGLVYVLICSLVPWPMEMPKNTIAKYGVGQDLTVAFVPLLLGIAGAHSMEPIAQGILGMAAFVSTTLLLWDLEALQRELNTITKKVEFAAHHDPVTDVQQRTALPSFQKTHTEGVTIVELVGMHEVNATYGFENGNGVLNEFSRRLTARVDTDGTVIRTSGTEFTIIWSRRIFDTDSRIRSITAIPFDVEDTTVYMSTQLGSVMNPEYPLDELIAKALTLKLKEQGGP